MPTTDMYLAAPQLATASQAGELSKKLKRIEYVPGMDVYHFGFDKKQLKPNSWLRNTYQSNRQ